MAIVFSLLISYHDVEVEQMKTLKYKYNNVNAGLCHKFMVTPFSTILKVASSFVPLSNYFGHRLIDYLFYEAKLGPIPLFREVQRVCKRVLRPHI